MSNDLVWTTAPETETLLRPIAKSRIQDIVICLVFVLQQLIARV